MADSSHLVLARKYRPKIFDELIGQDQLVRVLRNSFKMNKVAHGYILTGVRGVGKTTTARIIAKTLNCEKNKNKSDTTPIEDPCGICEQCVAIAEYRHVDVQEMDAASNNRIDNVRTIIDGVGYRPVLGQYRIYILDEAHMITPQAFNALLKTLEEPPPHLIFILATTEVQKIPATILSRCIRFDLRRIPSEQLTSHFAAILKNEKVTMSDSAIALIARAAEGSVRDGLSMLDQAIAINPEGVGEDDVLAMLGLSDISKIYHLIEHLMAGDAPQAINQYNDLVNCGGAPEMIIEQLMNTIHTMTKMKLDDQYHKTASLSETEKTQSHRLQQKLSMPLLARIWQMLLKGLSEIRIAPDPIIAGEMLLMRLMLVSDAPTPAELADAIKKKNQTLSPQHDGQASASAPTMEKKTLADIDPDKVSFADLVAMVGKSDMRLATTMRSHIRLIDYQFPNPDHGGKLRFQNIDSDCITLAEDIKQHLSKTTNSLWHVSLGDEAGKPTLDEALYEKIMSNKTVKLAMNLFPESKLISPQLNIKKK
ncbi:MAG: DNA polymerase III subunit gamma/tau [Alphaproteobacteria bacterium]